MAYQKPMKGEDFAELLQTKPETFNRLGMVSAKLDGIRILCNEGQALTNPLLPIPNVHIRRLMENPLLQGLDGEFHIGPAEAEGVYRRTYSAFSRHSDVPVDVRFSVFDCILDADGNSIAGELATRRQKILVDRITSMPPIVDPEGTLPPLQLAVLKQEPVMCAEDILRWEDIYLSAGYEGLMYRSAGGVYKFGRATLKQLYLAKLKRFDELDAEIVGTFEQLANDNEAYIDEAGRTKRSSHQENKSGKGTLGGFVMRLATGEVFNVGIGMNGSLTDKTRAEFWARRETLVGMWAKIGYQKYGMKGVIPRIPKFIALRDKADIG